MSELDINSLLWSLDVIYLTLPSIEWFIEHLGKLLTAISGWGLPIQMLIILVKIAFTSLSKNVKPILIIE
jgi:membrane protein insertase Oxa1/YidC/SpoIIIJ